MGENNRMIMAIFLVFAMVSPGLILIATPLAIVLWAATVIKHIF